jgi:hypothetical protein
MRLTAFQFIINTIRSEYKYKTVIERVIQLQSFFDGNKVYLRNVWLDITLMAL